MTNNDKALEIMDKAQRYQGDSSHYFFHQRRCFTEKEYQTIRQALTPQSSADLGRGAAPIEKIEGLDEAIARFEKDYRNDPDGYEEDVDQDIILRAAKAYAQGRTQSAVRPLCHSVDFGTYQNAVAIRAPWGKLVTVDICMIPEIKWLWDQGIQTIECCCGHGKKNGYVACIGSDRPKME